MNEPEGRQQIFADLCDYPLDECLAGLSTRIFWESITYREMGYMEIAEELDSVAKALACFRVPHLPPLKAGANPLPALGEPSQPDPDSADTPLP
jgi:hypothetical protein